MLIFANHFKITWSQPQFDHLNTNLFPIIILYFIILLIDTN